MCGIAGIVQWSQSRTVRDQVGAPPPPLCLIEIDSLRPRLDELLRHRGPDATGTWTANGPEQVLLLHRRLAVMDPAGGGQPMGNEDGNVQVVFNGEIYNHRELRVSLESRGHRFRSDHSDTEVLVHGWEEWSTALPEKLLGMFSFAIWDSRNHALFVARDRMGQKPLFFSQLPRQVAFASTLPALLACPGVMPQSSLALIQTYLIYGYLPPAHSIYNAIRQVVPGQWLCWREGCREEGQYWQPAGGDEPGRGAISGDDAAARIRKQLQAAVASQMEADVPIACFLSGGIDSGIVAALMQEGLRSAGGKIKTISVGFTDTSFNESGYARALAAAIGSEHHEFQLAPSNGALDTLAWLMNYSLGEPFADSSILPTYYAANCARMVAPCAISGDGADELFGGYDRYRAMLLLSRYRRLISTVLTGALKGRLARRERLYRLQAGAAQRHWAGQYANMLAVFSPAQIRDLFPALPARNAGLEWDRMDLPSGPTFRQAMRLDQRHYLPGDVLWKVDAASMACALEVRSPFLDHRVVELANALPGRLILNARRGKLALRPAFGDLLPAPTFRRRKHGFAVPIGSWLKNELKGPWQDLVCGGDSLTSQIARPGAAEQLLAEHGADLRDHTHRLFSLLMLELWYRRFRPQITAD